ncbi:MAG: WD40 repeat domain-containing protein [Planctomycetota bacterium]
MLSVLASWIACFTAMTPTPPAPIEHQLYRTQVAAAESALRLDELAEARRWLDETSVVLRGFEWRAHDAALDQSLEKFVIGASAAATIDVNSSASLVACGLADGAVELRSLANGELVTRLGSHASAVTSVRFDSAGARLVTTSLDRTVRVWSVEERRQLLEFTHHGFPVGGAAFSPDGMLIASCSYERPPNTVVGTVHIWNAADGSLVRTLEGGRKPLVGIEFSPDGRSIAAGSWDFCVFVWPVAGGEPLKCAVPEEGVYNAVDGVAFSFDGTLVAGASKDHTARIWSVSSGELVATLRGHTDAVKKVAFAPDGQSLASASADGTARLWNVSDASLRAVLRGHSDDVVDVRFAAAGARVVTSSLDGSLRLWDAATTWYDGPKVMASAAAYVARFSPDDQRVATASFDGRIQLWSAANWELLASFEAHPKDKSCHALAFTPDGRFLVSGSWEPTVRVWDSATLELVASFTQAAGTTWLSVSGDGALVAACSGKTIEIYDLTSRTHVQSFALHTKSTLSVNFDPTSRLCISCGRDGAALIWDARTGELLCEIRTPSADVADALFVAAGAQVLVAERNGRVALYQAADGALVRELVHHRHGVSHLDIAPDGARVALASEVVTLIDMDHGGVIGNFRPHRHDAYCVDFDSRGERLVSCATDGSIAVADTAPLRKQLRQRELARARRATIEPLFAARLAAGESLPVIADDVRSSPLLDRAELAAWIDLITMRAGRGRQ